MNKLDKETKNTLNTLSVYQFEALEKARDFLMLKWNTTSHKKETEFDTLWTLAVNDGKQQGVAEFLQLINNPGE